MLVATGTTVTDADAPDAYTNAPDALPDTSGASEMNQSSDDTLVPENTHNHTRTVNGALLQGPGTYAVTDALALASSEGFDRDDDADVDAVADADALSDADGRAESDSDVVTVTDSNGARDAPGAELCDPHAVSDGDWDSETDVVSVALTVDDCNGDVVDRSVGVTITDAVGEITGVNESNVRVTMLVTVTLPVTLADMLCDDDDDTVTLCDGDMLALAHNESDAEPEGDMLADAELSDEPRPDALRPDDALAASVGATVVLGRCVPLMEYSGDALK